MTDTTSSDTAIIRNSELSLGKRALYMVFFAIALRLAEFVVFLLMVSQFIAKAATKKPINALTAFGDQLSHYIAQIVRFQTFNTDELVFPFKPSAECSDTKSSASSSDQPSASDKEHPNPA